MHSRKENFVFVIHPSEDKRTTNKEDGTMFKTREQRKGEKWQLAKEGDGKSNEKKLFIYTTLLVEQQLHLMSHNFNRGTKFLIIEKGREK